MEVDSPVKSWLRWHCDSTFDGVEEVVTKWIIATPTKGCSSEKEGTNILVIITSFIVLIQTRNAFHMCTAVSYTLMLIGLLDLNMLYQSYKI